VSDLETRTGSVGSRPPKSTGAAPSRRDTSTLPAIMMLARHEIRRRWRGVVVIGLLGGLTAGAGLAFFAGARRTDSLFGRHLAASNSSQLEIDPGAPTPEADSAIRSMPEVAEASFWVTTNAFLLDDDGTIDPSKVGMLNFTTDGRYLDQDRVPVSSGRRLDVSRPDEVMINPTLAEIMDARVGTKLRLGLAPTDENDFPTTDQPTRTVTAEVVGIMALPDDLIGAELDRVPKMFVSPVFAPPDGSRDDVELGFAWYGLRLRGGEGDVDRTIARWDRLAADHNATLTDPTDGGWLTFNHPVRDLIRTADRSVSPMVGAFTTFGALAFIGALVIMAQVLARTTREGMDDVRRAQVLGLTANEATLAAMASPVLTLTIAAGAAATAMAALSTRFPAGPYRILEPSPGFDVDWLVLAAGLSLLVLLPLATSTVAARHHARSGLLNRQRDMTRASALVGWLGRRGARPPAVAAVRLTVESGRGQAFVPTRLVLATGIVVVALLVTAIVFGSNLAALNRDPERFGWRADGLLMIDGGYGRINPDTATDWLDARNDLDGWQLAGAASITVNERKTPGVLFGPEGGTGATLRPVLIRGRAPARSGEVVVGERTRTDLGVEIGDSVTLGNGATSRAQKVTGIAVFPELGPVLAARTRLDDGLWSDASDADLFGNGYDVGPPFNLLLADFVPGANPEAFADDFGTSPMADGSAFVDRFGVIRPPEVRTAATAASSQSAMVAAAAVVAAISLLLTLLSVVRRRRRDFRIMSILGFTPRQLRVTVMLQGLLFGLVGIVVGVPLGLAIGRQVWHRFAQTMGVVPDASTPWGTIFATAAAILVLATLTSIPPAVAAGRSKNRRIAAE